MSDPSKPTDATMEMPRGEVPGGRIGPFKILQQLGEGGFGSVFEAEQEQPVRRRVALKVIKLGMDTREVIARFEAERQALALMDHPHIARVLDAGATESGRPYFVMELVKGEPISSYCRKHSLSITQRLNLFDQVCAAVQHAHTKGIIHRDLKPSNVLVSMQDDQPFAKVIDFGIAKATSGRLTDKTLFTEQFLMMGTPLYMSPEQAEGSPDIDTRTDIYALGVILYELLTDTTPLDSHSLRSAGYAEVQRIIREVEPPRPSARLSRSITAKLGADAKHQDAPRKLAKMLRGELDWIVMKAIEKDRTRRYETANGLAMDLRRYLAGEPVLAAPPSAVYRMQKFVRRNKVVVTAGVLVAAALLVGIVGFAWQAHIAQQQEHLAQQRADELEQVSKFQAEMLGQVDLTQSGKMLSDDVRTRFEAALVKAGLPEAERRAQLAAFAGQWQRVDAAETASDLIDRTILKPAVVAIDKQFKDQPAVDATLRQVLADRYADMGLYDAALPLQQRALATRRRVLGEEHPDTLASINGMGALLEAQGKLDEAEPLLRTVVAVRRRVLGGTQPDTLVSVNELGLLLRTEGKLGEAEPYAREALEKRRRVLGEENRYTLMSANNLGLVLQDQNKLAEAEPYFREALEAARRVLGEEYPDTIYMINNMGMLLHKQGKYREAEPYSREALEKARRVWGDENPLTLEVLNNMGKLLLAEGKPDFAERYVREALEKNRRVQGEDHPDTLISVSLVGELLVAQGKHAEAEKLLVPAEAAVRKTFTGDQTRRVAAFLLQLGKARTGLGKFAAAEGNLLEAQPIFFKALGAKDQHTRDCLRAVIYLYAAWNTAEPGKGYDLKAAEWKRKLDALGA